MILLDLKIFHILYFLSENPRKTLVMTFSNIHNVIEIKWRKALQNIDTYIQIRLSWTLLSPHIKFEQEKNTTLFQHPSDVRFVQMNIKSKFEQHKSVLAKRNRYKNTHFCQEKHKIEKFWYFCFTKTCLQVF